MSGASGEQRVAAYKLALSSGEDKIDLISTTSNESLVE